MSNAAACECVCVCEHWAIPYSISIYGAALILFAGLWLLELWAGGLSLLSPQELDGVGGLPESKHGLFILTCLCVRPGEKTWKQRESEWVLKKLNFAIFHKWMLCRHKDHRLASWPPGQNVQMQKESNFKSTMAGTAMQCQFTISVMQTAEQLVSGSRITGLFLLHYKCAIIFFYRL